MDGFRSALAEYLIECGPWPDELATAFVAFMKKNATDGEDTVRFLVSEFIAQADDGLLLRHVPPHMCPGCGTDRRDMGGDVCCPTEAERQAEDRHWGDGDDYIRDEL